MIETKNQAPKITKADDPDKWTSWKPVWTGRRHATPHDCQESHSPSTPVFVQTTHNRKTQRSMRRIVDARLWEAMTPPQQDAALEIAMAAHLATLGIGFKTSPSGMQRIESSPGNQTDRQAALISFYFSWAKTCKRERLSAACILDILLFGKSCRQVDKERKIRNGSARHNLIEGLKLYCQLRGWPY